MKKIKLDNIKKRRRCRLLTAIILFSVFILNIGTVLASPSDEGIEPDTYYKVTFIIKTLDGEPIKDAEINIYKSTGDLFVTHHTDSNGETYEIFCTIQSYAYSVQKESYKTFNGTFYLNEDKTINIKLAQTSDILHSSTDKTPGFELLTLMIALFVTILLLRYERKK